MDDDLMLIREAGLTDGEAKVYLTLLELGPSTTGPVVEKSGVANSIIYRILDNLIEKGLASFVIKDGVKHFQAAQPEKILDYIDERKRKLETDKETIKALLPKLRPLQKAEPETVVRQYEGFKGFQTAWELYYTKLKKGDVYHSWGVYPVQGEEFHLYWQRDHVRRETTGIKGQLLFNQGTDPKILRNRNSYKGIDARYMPTDIKTPAWFIVYKDVVGIYLQKKKPIVVQIFNQEIADSFEAYFQDMWKRTKPFK